MTFKPIEFYISNALPPEVRDYFQTLTWEQKYQLSSALSIVAHDEMIGELMDQSFPINITTLDNFKGFNKTSIEDVAS
jgi:hypothetical protein